MDRLRGLVASLALSLLVGCHLTGDLPVDLGEGHGRVDRTFTASLPNSVRATLGALDDLEIHPKGGTVRANDAVSNLGKPGWATATNDDFFPDNEAFHDLFDAQRLSVKGADPIPFAPILMAYKGETGDGRAVSVVVRSQPPEALRTQVMARIGREGDAALCQQLLDRIAERLNAMPTPQPALPTLPK